MPKTPYSIAVARQNVANYYKKVTDKPEQVSDKSTACTQLFKACFITMTDRALNEFRSELLLSTV